MLAVLSLLPAGVSAGRDSLQARIEAIIAHAGGSVGVAVLGPDPADTLFINGDRRFPMQSVVKFPLGLAVLQRVDRGELSLTQPLHLTAQDLLPDTWSPLRERHPSRDVTLPLADVLAATVSESDNNGCDVLFRLLGGPAAVQKSIRDLGIQDIAILSTEAEMHADDKLQFENWSTPRAMARFLAAFTRGTVLSDSGTAWLRDQMVRSPTGPRRLNGGLPPGTVVAHKTGSSGEDERGIASATNDAGIVVLPDGREVIIVVFITASPDDERARDAVIAGISRAVWDHINQP
jgi:beta-lactamase class A